MRRPIPKPTIHHATHTLTHTGENDDAFSSSALSASGAPPAATGADDNDPGAAAWVGLGVEERGEGRARRFACLRHAFYNAVDRFGPNDFFVMQKCMKEDSVRFGVGVVVLGHWVGLSVCVCTRIQIYTSRLSPPTHLPTTTTHHPHTYSRTRHSRRWWRS